jgi:predicted nucleic acid-binding protein
VRVFCDTGVLVRYFVGDDPARSLAAARMIDGDDTVVVSTAVLVETIHVLRSDYRVPNPDLGIGLIRLLSRSNVELVDADQAAAITAIHAALRLSPRRIPDALVASAAEAARCEIIASFDEGFLSHAVPVRLL